MSRATKAAKEKAEKERIEVPVPATVPKVESIQPSQTTTPVVELPVRPQRRIVPNMVLRPKKEDEDDDEWGTPSDEDGDDDFRPSANDEDAASEYSFTTKSQPREFEPILPPILPKPKLQPHLKINVNPSTKSYQKPAGPQRKRVTARERIDLKKAAQKAARKESKRNAAQAARQLEITSVNVSKAGPPLDLGIGIKTLYI